jgi:hypothetical protein
MSHTSLSCRSRRRRNSIMKLFSTTLKVSCLSCRRRYIFIALVIVSALLSLMRFDSFQVGAYTDDAYYIVLAEALANGHGYRLVNFPDAPVEWTFPPGWPLLLVPLTIVFPGNYVALKGLSFVLWIGALILIYKLFSTRINSPYLELLMALIAVNPDLVGASAQVMSETAYLFFSFLALNLLDLWHSSNAQKLKVSRDLVLCVAAVMVVFVQSIRTIGFSLTAGVFLYFLVSRRYREALTIVLVAVLGLVPQLILYMQRGVFFVSPGYEAQVLSGGLGVKLLHMLVNLHAYVTGIVAHTLVPILGPNIVAAFDRLGLGTAPSFINLLVMLLIVFGFAVKLRTPQFIEWYIVLYVLGILAFWNPLVGSAQARFLIPVIPFLYYYGMQGFISVGQALAVRLGIQKCKLRCARVKWIALVCVCVIFLILVARNVQDVLQPIRMRMTDLVVGNEWIYEHAPPDAIIMTRDPVPDYLYSRRKTVAYPKSGQRIDEYVAATGVDYIVIKPKLQIPRTDELDDFTKNELLPAIVGRADRYDLVYSDTTHNVMVYQVRSFQQ